MNEELQFANPLWLWTGVLSCCALIYGFVIWNRKRQHDLQKLAHSRSLDKLTESCSRRRRWIKQGLWVAALFLVFVCVARPQYGYEYREVKRRGIDLVFAIDTSRSMLAEDVVPNRLERSQLAITDFVDRLEGDRIGLIPFAGNAFSLCPLTLDYSAFRQSLDAIDTDIIPHQGTDLASAVKEANRLFDVEGNSHRILILITDGEDLQGAVAQAISAAKEKNMVIHTVGVGDPEGALIPVVRNGGYQDFIRDETGQPVRTSLDEVTLREISESTDGIYVPLGKSGQGLNQIYQEKLRLVPKSEMDQRLDRIPLEKYEWPLALAILLLVIEYLMSDRRRTNRVDSVAKRAFNYIKSKQAAAILVAGLFIATADGAEVDPRQIYNSGTNAYEAGDFEKAEQSLSQSIDNAIDLSLQQRGYYNLGNTRYRLGQKALESNPEETIKRWEASIKAYEDALALDSDDKDAAFNRDFVKKKLEELKQQQQDQQQQDQDQQQQDQQQQDQQQQDQQQQDQQQQDQQQQDQQQQDQQQQDQQQQDQQQQNQQQQDQQQQQSAENSGDQSAQQQNGEQSEQQPDSQSFSEERRSPGEMSREEAAQLLEALMKDETTVNPLPDRRTYQRSVPSNSTRGKTW